MFNQDYVHVYQGIIKMEKLNNVQNVLEDANNVTILKNVLPVKIHKYIIS